MSVAAVFPERIVCADEVPSRFGGTRLRLTDLPRRIDPVSGAVDDNGLDIARLLSRPLNAGQPRRAAALVRRVADAAVPPAPTAETQSLTSLLASWSSLAAARGVSSMSFVQRLFDGPDAAAVRAALALAGISAQPLVARTQRSLLVLDDSELLVSPSWRVVADAGQGALLATGLAADVAAVLVEAAGSDGAEVWEKGFDDVGRAVFVQRIERAIRAAVSHGSLRLAVTDLLPPLALSTSKVAALSALTDPPPKAIALAHTLRQRQRTQWQCLAKLVVELRVPAARPAWWARHIAELALPPGAIDLLAAPGAVTTDLVAALVEHGQVVDEPSSSWLHVLDDADDRAAGLMRSLMPAPPVIRAVGGVRAGDDFSLQAGPGEAPMLPPLVNAAVVVPVVVVDEGRTVLLPPGVQAPRVTVDAKVLSSTSFGFTPAGRTVPDGPHELRLPESVRYGSVVVVSWDSTELES